LGGAIGGGDCGGGGGGEDDDLVVLRFDATDAYLAAEQMSGKGARLNNFTTD